MLSLREYQADAFSATMSGFEGGSRSQLVVMPTGTGKTVFFGAVSSAVVELGGRVLVLAHRGELIQQAANTLSAWGLEPAIEMAGYHAMPRFTRSSKFPDAHMEDIFGNEIDPGTEPSVVIGSVQTFQGRRLKAWPPSWFKLVICDEAHHAAADSYRRAVDHLSPDWYLGVTATWDRGDRKPIVGPDQIFERLAFEYPMVVAVESGYLARPMCEVLQTSVELDEIRTTAGDLNAGDLEKAIAPAVEELVNAALPYVRERVATIVFTPDVGSADAVASAFSGMRDKDGKPCGVPAMSVSGMDADRNEIVSGFKRGDFKVLCNCALLTEGFDAPHVDTIIVMRPTKSRSLMVQMIGRGTRIYPGKKDCLVIGYDWKTMKHKLVHPVEIFHGPGLEPVDVDGSLPYLAGDTKDMLLAVRKSEAERKRRDRLRVEARERAKSRTGIRFDPLGVDPDISITPNWEGSDFVAKPATDKQLSLLERFGFKPAEVEGWSCKRAAATLDSMFMRAKAGLATKKQVDLLNRCGVPSPETMKMSEASAMIDRIKSSGWRYHPSMAS